MRWTSLLVLVLLVPIVSVVLKQVGPLLLAGRPAFDDMIDALTFGVAAGAAFAAAETIVVNRGLFSSFGQVDIANAGFWVSLVLSAAIVKPIVYGAATGIAVAGFSGLGAGYDGFKPAYFRGPGEALLALVLFQAGLFFASRSRAPRARPRPGLGCARRRRARGPAALPAALRGARGGAGGGGDRRRAQGHRARDGVLPLVRDAAAAGRELLRGLRHVRAGRQQGDPGPQPVRRHRAAGTPRRPSLKSTPEGVAPQDNKRTVLVVGAVAATILLAGVVGQAAAAAAADEDDAAGELPVDLQTQVGTGPTTDPAPSPVPAPGPTPDASEGAVADTSRRR